MIEEALREEEKETKRDGQGKGSQKSAQLREIVGLLGEENPWTGEVYSRLRVPAWTQCVTGTCDVPDV